MPITADQPRDDDLFPEQLRLTKDGYFGLKTFRVVTDVIEKAILAGGLPKIGEPWNEQDPELKACVCVEVGTPRRLGGRDSDQDGGDAGGRVGWMAVPCTYATPNPTTFVVAERGKSYTEFDNGEDTDTVYKELERVELLGVPLVQGAPINNGDGAQRSKSRLSARITSWYDMNYALPISLFVTLSNPSCVNDAPIELPRIFGTNRPLPFTRGQVLYKGWDEIGPDQGLLKVVQRVELAADWHVRWVPEDSQGNARNGRVTSRIYEYANFTGLWIP